jgi:dTDP-glucose pyrophosphorylase
VVDVKAVLLAAGRGTRLGQLTAATPKPLLQVGGRPIIAHILDGLAAAGVAEVLIVVGYLGDQIERELGTDSPHGIRLTYARQERPLGTASAVALAKHFVSEEQFFLGWGDIFVDRSNYARVVEAARSADGALAVNEVPDPTSGGAVYVDDSMRVTWIVEKPAAGSSRTRWNNAGLMVLPPGIWPHVDALEPSWRQEYELPEAISAYVAAGGHLRAVPIDGLWFDVGTPEDLEAARAAFE